MALLKHHSFPLQNTSKLCYSILFLFCLPVSLTNVTCFPLCSSSFIHPSVKKRVKSSFPHFGHSGIVETARDLYTQIEGNPGDESQSGGFVSSLLGVGCECEGYNLRVVGHSLGGSIAALLGIRLYGKFPNLHVYSYGPLPCVDSVVADACSDFITSIIHDNEFSTRLSVGSILRLRASAITALSENTQADTTLILRLARQFLYASKNNSIELEPEPAKSSTRSSKGETRPFSEYPYLKHTHVRHKVISRCKVLLRELTTCAESEDKEQESCLYDGNDGRQNHVDIENTDLVNPFASVLNQSDDPISQFMQTVSRSENSSATDPTEMYLPGLLIHIVPQSQNLNIPLWKSWRIHDDHQKYKAFFANRDDLKDIIVSPNMFFDHLPWRCNKAMQKVVEAGSTAGNPGVSHIV
ncbi:hypothetical protein Godav_012908 [Gossypium davidsonii]|uniref:Fungal lipase-type domain-containing protein n=1 Tax=Gossypium davidsonii TaxID=34287 RepID=A0A7J8REM8_GOSDV|nr:hypothetical protein [Gossypium davidsonii]